MPRLLVAVIYEMDEGWEVLRAWEQAGVREATVIDSAGMRHVLQPNLRDDAPMFPSLHSLMAGHQERHYTIFAVVNEDVDLEAIVRTTEAIVGPLSQPNTGIIFVLPVMQVWGLKKDMPRTQ